MFLIFYGMTILICVIYFQTKNSMQELTIMMVDPTVVYFVESSEYKSYKSGLCSTL